MSAAKVRPLSEEDRLEVFRIATRGLPKRHQPALDPGMSDRELGLALEEVLGIFGGSCGPDRLSVTYCGAGLRIWGGWHIVNHVTEQPLFKGAQTIAMARVVWDIADPTDLQLGLFGPDARR